ncbi:hypothetical protein BLOT_006979 [Blomia tropicalis]|nr:hypothetical protein BLOT_006979 [Blomia tropicalis]
MTATLDRLQLYLTVYVTKNRSKINAFVCNVTYLKFEKKHWQWSANKEKSANRPIQQNSLAHLLGLI